jgi:hypothetical protein
MLYQLPHSPKQLISLLALLLVLLPGYTFGQLPVRHIKGYVVDDTNHPLHKAAVSLADTGNRIVATTATDSSGHFTLSYRIKGNYVLVISSTAHTTYRSAPFQLADTDAGRLQLNRIAQTLDAVTVTAKQKLIELDGGNIVYNVSKSINAQGTNALEALKKAPGVYVDNDNTISLNGKQGAMILLNGKQTYLSGKELADLLRSMPSSEIKSIEIINNPSAKYDAAGSAGIINIKTSKSQLAGFSGTITTGVSYGVSLKQNQDLSFNYRKNKYNIYGSYNHFLGNYSYLYGSDRVQENKFYNSNTDDIDQRKKMGSRLGADYTINAKNTIGIMATGNFLFGGGITRTHTSIGDPATQHVEQVLDAVNDYYYQQTNRYNLNVNYKYEDSLGRMINIDADYGHYNKNSGNLQSNRYSDEHDNTLSEHFFRTLNSTSIQLKALKIDHTTNLWNGKLESGVKYSSVNADTESKFLHALSNGDSLDERRSNNFRFTEKIASAYLNYKRTQGKWTIQAGMRLENARSEGSLYFKLNGAGAAEYTGRNYTNLFPSVSVTVKPVENHSFSIGYSRRIDRPAYQDLNPFIYLLDELSFWQGNPFLQPQLSHRVTLQYAYKSATIIGLTFAYTNDYSARITDTIESTKIVMIPKNLGIQKNLALTITQNISVNKWWDLTFNGTLYHIQNTIAFDQYRNLDLKQLAGRISLQQTYKLPYKISAEIMGFFNSKRLSGANERINPNSQIDLAFQRPLLQDKAMLRLAFSDLYKGSKSNSQQSFTGFYVKSYGYYESRQVRLNFTYKFANSTIKGPRSRNSALENENNRIR